MTMGEGKVGSVQFSNMCTQQHQLVVGWKQETIFYCPKNCICAAECCSIVWLPSNHEVCLLGVCNHEPAREQAKGRREGEVGGRKKWGDQVLFKMPFLNSSARKKLFHMTGACCTQNW